MLETLALRALALASIVLAGAVAWSALASEGEDWRRLLARALFAALLLWLARLAWRRPQGRAARVRRRVLRLVGVLARPELQREWAESSPSTDMAEALLADWDRATNVAEAALAGAFAPDELAEILELRKDVTSLAGRLPVRDAAATSAWTDLVRRAAVTHESFVARARARSGDALSGSA